MKGAATSIQVFIFILIAMLLLGMYIKIVTNTTEKTIKMNTESLELSKLSSTFYLVNRSLYTTWYVSAVQSMFAAGFDGLGCGDDNKDFGGGYWYRGDTSHLASGDSVIFPIMFPAKVKTGEDFTIQTFVLNSGNGNYAQLACTIKKPDSTEEPVTSDECVEIKNSVQEIMLKARTDAAGNYIVTSCSISRYSDSGCSNFVAKTDISPNSGLIEAGDYDEGAPVRKYSSKICMPNNTIIADFINANFASYKYIARDAKANGINIHVGSNVPEEMNKNSDIISKFHINDNDDTASVSHQISLNSASSSTITQLEHNVVIDAPFGVMASDARNAIGNLLMMRGSMTGGANGINYNFYRALQYDKEKLEREGVIEVFGGENKDEYAKRVMTALKNIGSGSGTDVKVGVNDMNFVVLKDSQAYANGIALHYDIDMTLTEKTSTVTRKVETNLERDHSGTFGWQWPTDVTKTDTGSKRITSCFGETRSSETGKKTHKGLDIGSAKPGDDDYTDDIYASGGDTDILKIVKVNKGCSDGDTGCGGGYGNYVELENGKNKYHILYAHLYGIDDDITEGGDVPSGRGIGTMGNTGRSTGKHLHFEVRAPDGTKLNPCDFIDCSRSVLQTCTSGSGNEVVTEEVPAKGYYFYNEEDNKFEKLPMQFRIRAEDYLPAIDCGYVFSSGLWLFKWDKDSEVGIACNKGNLYTCGTANNIQGMTISQSLQEGQQIPGEPLVTCTSTGFR